MATSARAWLSAQDSRLRVLLPVAAFSLAAVVLTVTGLYWVAARSDRGAIERQTREAEDAISDAVDDVARAQEIVTVWDQSVLELRKPVPDLDWVDENLAFVLHRMFDHNQFFILDGQEQAIYASEPEGRKAASDYAEIRPALQHLVDKVRGRLVVPPNKHERLP